MVPKSKGKKRSDMKKSLSPLKVGGRDIPAIQVATTSKEPVHLPTEVTPAKPKRRKCLKYLYNRENKTFCGRTCKSWLAIVCYSIMYILFLSTYTLIFLFGSLTALKYTSNYQTVDKAELLTYGENGIGLSATPASVNGVPLIWYRSGKSEDYQKYTSALDRLLQKNRRKRELNNTDLGPCAYPPYGFGDQPCIIIKINKQLKWKGNPLEPNSARANNAPTEVKKWLRSDKKMLWLHCTGFHSYDKEHVGHIKYYPDPPGFDPDIFPLDMQSKSPLVAVQISNFTVGISLAIECKLWYDKGPSSVDFILYVAPDIRTEIQ
ncbi:sodium/potassium-transporting ATPase subunit beta-1-like [Galleria mellonella]|uniref:Sodium/potassium-transporting ATPase subunit beta-1-like n=1 Tax=Galleria mellonella TaxID=7137 RepID=A0A6J1WVH0_GALME|nr:sodium/potassium-transporting ATPase subunit beta-1-like [Galleria mellonella]